MPRDYDNDDIYPDTYRDLDTDDLDFDAIDDDELFDDDDDYPHDDEDVDTLFDDDGDVSDRGYALLADMDRNGYFA